MADRTISSSKNQSKRTFPCSHANCIATFKKNAHLLRHQLIHNDERPFVCSLETCNKAFRSPFHLKRHEAIHGGEKKFKCEYDGCKVSCITEWNLKRHIKRTHCGTFKCTKCEQEFKKNKLLQQHVSLEHKTSTICCEFPGCAQIFSVPSKMKHHMKVHTLKGYTCPVKDCSMKFQLWSECRLHTAQCKNKEKKCDVCGKIFIERSNLKAHMKIHSEEREVYQCTYDKCGRFYTKQSNLQAHIQSYHKNIRPYVCPKSYCQKSFHYQHLLRRHLEYHANNDKQDKEHTQRKHKRSKRMVTSTLSKITGYIPELQTKMNAGDIEAYLGKEGPSSCYADTDVIPRDLNDGETTQTELTPVVSDDLEPIGIRQPVATMDLTNPSVMIETLEPKLYRSSEETLTIATSDNDVSEFEEPLVYEPMRSLEEACSYLDRSNKKEKSGSTPSSSNSSRTASGEESCFPGWENRLRAIVKQKRKAFESCRMQSMTESDSSDSEVKKKVRFIMQHLS